MGFELLFEMGEETLLIEGISNPYFITLKLSEDMISDYSYQLLLYRSNLKEEINELVRYTETNNFMILQKDVLLIDNQKHSCKPYFLEIEIKAGTLRKVGTIHLSANNPKDINSYRTKFIK